MAHLAGIFISTLVFALSASFVGAGSFARPHNPSLSVEDGKAHIFVRVCCQFRLISQLVARHVNPMQMLLLGIVCSDPEMSSSAREPTQTISKPSPSPQTGTVVWVFALSGDKQRSQIPRLHVRGPRDMGRDGAQHRGTTSRKRVLTLRPCPPTHAACPR